MQSVTATQTSRKNGFRSLLVETLENRQLCAVDYADAIDVVRSTAMLKNVESAVIRTGRTQTVTVSGSLSSTQQQDHSFLEKVNVPGSFTADVTIRLEKNVLVEQFNVRNTFTGRSQLDDIDLAAIAADVSVRGTYRVSVANRAPSRVLSADWRSEGTANVTILSGPARGSDYTLTLLVTDGREYGDKLSGLSTSELVGNSVRNAVPVKTPLANWAGEVLQRAEKLRIPNNDFQKALSNYRLVADLFSSAGSRTNDQIYQDLLKSKSFVVGIQSESDLLRFAQGGVTTIVGAKFSLQRSWDQVITNIPIVNNAPLFGGLVTASVGAEASLGVSVTLAGVFAADSRGWGFSEGTAATLELRLEALLKGNEYEDYEVEVAHGHSCLISKLVEPAFAKIEELGLTIESAEVVLVNNAEGYAGTTDVKHRSAKGKGILDWKSKRTKEGEDVIPNETHPMQIAAYYVAAFNDSEFTDALCMNVYISTTEPGRVDVVKYDRETLVEAYKDFLCLTRLYRSQNNYDPRNSA